jgi:hypothetical protein
MSPLRSVRCSNWFLDQRPTDNSAQLNSSDQTDTSCSPTLWK